MWREGGLIADHTPNASIIPPLSIGPRTTSEQTVSIERLLPASVISFLVEYNMIVMLKTIHGL